MYKNLELNSKGCYQGKGTILSRSGTIYTGYVEKCIQNGEGKETRPDGVTYTGNWLNGKFDG